MFKMKWLGRGGSGVLVGDEGGLGMMLVWLVILVVCVVLLVVVGVIVMRWLRKWLCVDSYRWWRWFMMVL